jgi:acetylornithine deacetylase/succinyl-diaminopimelate desuccinylase-like protein
MTPVLRIDQDRLWNSLMELSRIGAYTDAETGLTGVDRQTLTDADFAGRHLVTRWMREAGLQVRVDAMGNVFGRRSGTDADAAPVLVGSHIDTVATAGAFDGCLGVLGGIEVVRTLDEHGVCTRRPVEIPSVVPDRAEITVDLRNPDDQHMAAAEADHAAYLDRLQAGDPRLRIEAQRMARTRHVPFDEGVQKIIAGSMDDLGLEHLSLMSGAGHDAQEIAAIAPAAMIFVRGESDGISHNPREYSTPEACARGVDVLATTVLRLADEP